MAGLTPEQVAQFKEDGVLIATDVLTDADLQPVIDELSDFIDRRARELKADGKITELHEGEGFATRFPKLYAQDESIGAGMDIMQLRGERMFGFLRNENLLDVIESLIGPEITCSPIQHVRAKVPASLTDGKPDYFNNVPWHQDAGVTWEEADPTEIITAWIPLVDATRENGCMEVMPQVWKQGQMTHVKSGGTTIEPSELPGAEPIVAECPKGGIVLMNKYTPHRSTPNYTEEIRWSLDLRYQPTGMPTGRPFHPDFVARSRAHPDKVLSDPEQWRAMWVDALEKSKGTNLHARAK